MVCDAPAKGIEAKEGIKPMIWPNKHGSRKRWGCMNILMSMLFDPVVAVYAPVSIWRLGTKERRRFVMTRGTWLGRDEGNGSVDHWLPVRNYVRLYTIVWVYHWVVDWEPGWELVWGQAIKLSCHLRAGGDGFWATRLKPQVFPPREHLFFFSSCWNH